MARATKEVIIGSLIEQYNKFNFECDGDKFKFQLECCYSAGRVSNYKTVSRKLLLDILSDVSMIGKEIESIKPKSETEKWSQEVMLESLSFLYQALLDRLGISSGLAA